MGPHRRPSASLVISILALAISITGVAAALPGENTVNSGDIVNGSIRSIDLRDGAGVDAEDVVPDAIGSGQLAPDSVGSSELAADSVGSSELTADSVGTVELGPNAVLSGNIGASQVTSADIGSNAIRASEIGDGIVLRLGPIVQTHSGTPSNGDWAGGISVAECLPGEELISGAARFASNEGDSVGAELAIGELDLDPVAETVKAIGLNDFYADAQFRATAMCLLP